MILFTYTHCTRTREYSFSRSAFLRRFYRRNSNARQYTSTTSSFTRNDNEIEIGKFHRALSFGNKRRLHLVRVVLFIVSSSRLRYTNTRLRGCKRKNNFFLPLGHSCARAYNGCQLQRARVSRSVIRKRAIFFVFRLISDVPAAHEIVAADFQSIFNRKIINTFCIILFFLLIAFQRDFRPVSCARGFFYFFQFFSHYCNTSTHTGVHDRARRLYLVRSEVGKRTRMKTNSECARSVDISSAVCVSPANPTKTR